MQDLPKTQKLSTGTSSSWSNTNFVGSRKREEIISSGSQTFWFRLIRTRQKQLVWLLKLFEGTDTTHCEQFFTWSINFCVHQLFQKALEKTAFRSNQLIFEFSKFFSSTLNFHSGVFFVLRSATRHKGN